MADRTDYEDVGGGVQLIVGETDEAVRSPVLVRETGQLITREDDGYYSTMQELLEGILAELVKVNLQLATMTGIVLEDDI